MTIHRKQITKNAFRITKTRGKTALRIRVPGGHLVTEHLLLIHEIAEKYGNGTVHITIRQGFEIPGIRFEDMDAINKMIYPLIESLHLSVETNEQGGYPAAGTRNISACVGNRVCPFANDDTTALAQRIEKAVFPHDLHFKIAVTGCPNDCVKAHMQDFGIICTTEPQYDPSRCISCNACAENCRKKVTGALEMVDYNIERNHDLCIGCGECILKCPTGAWSRSSQKFYRMVIMGRTGKKNPRLAMGFINWSTEAVVLQIIKNCYTFVDTYIDRSLAKEHVGYVVDREGYKAFRDAVLENVTLNPEATVAESIEWPGYWYKHESNFKKGV